MGNSETKVIVPQPSRPPVAPLREAFDLDDLLDEDGILLVPGEDE